MKNNLNLHFKINIFNLILIAEPLKKKLDSWKDLFLKYSEMKVNRKYYTDAVLKCDAGTLHHTLENKSAKLLTVYPDENENN